MIDLAKVVLGRHAHDPGRVAALPSHVMAASKPPIALDRSSIPFTPGLYENDTLPICTACATANCARAYSWIKTQVDTVVQPAMVPAFFAACLSIPNTPAAIGATDGAVMLDILDMAQSTGYDVGQPSPLYPTVHAIDFGDRMALADAILRYGAANIGIALAMADQRMQVWDIYTPADAGDPTPGSWGLHDTFIWDYDGLDDTSLVRIGTWGYWQQATWRWVRKAVEEAYRLNWPQLDPAPGGA
jgi:hypothetical protein